MKFTQFKRKELASFQPKRLVYAGETPDEITQAATKEIKEAADKVEDKVKLDKMDPYEAVKKAKSDIFLACQLAKAKIAPTEYHKHKDTIIKLLAELDKAKGDANKKLDDNLNHYVEVAAFIKKRTELELLIEGNKTAMGSIEVQLLIDGIAILDRSATSFAEEIKTLGGMPDVGLEKEKKDLQAKLEGQKKEMEKLEKKLIGYHKEKIAMHDDDLVAIKKRFEEGYMGPSVLSDRTIMDMYAHLYYLDSLRVKSADSLEVAGLTQEVEKRRKDFEDTLARAEKMTPIGSTLKDDHKPYWEAYKLSRDNYLRAEANLKAVNENPKSTRAEKMKAQSWFDGAQQTAGKDLDSLKKKYVQFREGEDNLKTFERDKESADRGSRSEMFLSTTLKDNKELWDKYDTLTAKVKEAEAEVEATKSKGKGSKENQDAEVKLYQAKKKLTEHEGAIRKQYVNMGPNDVTEDLYEEKFYDGSLRKGVTTVEHPEPKEKPEKEKPAPKPKEKKKPTPEVPGPLPVAGDKQKKPTKEA